jgi:hypothetical protein
MDALEANPPFSSSALMQINGAGSLRRSRRSWTSQHGNAPQESPPRVTRGFRALALPLAPVCTRHTADDAAVGHGCGAAHDVGRQRLHRVPA